MIERLCHDAFIATFAIALLLTIWAYIGWLGYTIWKWIKREKRGENKGDMW